MKSTEEQKAYQKAYYEANKEKINAINKAYNEANKEKIKEYQKEYNKAYYEANKDKHKAYQKEYYEATKEANKEQKKERNKLFYQANKEYYKKYNKAYREANKENNKAKRDTKKVLKVVSEFKKVEKRLCKTIHTAKTQEYIQYVDCECVDTKISDEYEKCELCDGYYHTDDNLEVEYIDTKEPKCINCGLLGDIIISKVTGECEECA
jgi:hypothetical protein